MNLFLGQTLSLWVKIALVFSTGSAIAADPVGQATPSVEHCIKKKIKKPLEYKQLAYPLCFYDTDQGAVADAKKFWQTYPEKIDKIISSHSKYADAVISTSRVVFIRATMYRHKQIATIWPDVACVGLSGGNESSNMLRICKSYVREYVDMIISGKDPSEVSIQPVCQTFIDVDGN